MSDMPSIGDLTKKNAGSGGLQVSSDDVREKFEKKMGQVAMKEQEIEAKRVADVIGVPHIDLEKFPVSHEALRQIPEEQARELGAVCFFISSGEVRVGALDPEDEQVADLAYQIGERNHANSAVYLVSQRSLDRMFELYKTLPIVEPVTKDISIRTEDLEKVQADVQNFQSFQALLKKASTSELVTFLLGASLKLDASDLHVEAEENRVVVRLRLDGVLHDAAEIRRDAFKQLVSRIKLNASLKINITDKPQDGRFSIKLPDSEVDVRVSTMPTVYGESIVMRLLRQNRKGLTLNTLGITGQAFEQLQREIMRPNGMIITTGPTGSGKTTTLYSIMQLLNKPDVKIITLEDPVEYKMEGINHSQIDHGKGYTFASGLKSILRQDPDIAMVGEIRDLETAEIAIQAALTGHLMLSTIHTNSAAGAIPRFLSMGVKPFLLAPALNAVMGQRLVRRLRDDKKVPAELTSQQQERVQKIIESMPAQVRAEVEQMPQQFFTAPEYDDEGDLGYSGRIGIYEILPMSSELEQMILSGQVSEFEIEKHAVSQGMVTMVQDGVIRALQGITSLDEVFRVIE